MKNIIIVESPSKSKTIESYMGEDYKVLSSKGHIRDLATSGPDGLGIDINNGFQPIYKIIKDKEKLVKELKESCKGAKVFLATDPDREGEAISYHLATVLGLSFDELNRVEFNEVTKPAIQNAFLAPRKIDMDLVSSQETRRMLDRIIGFKLSKLMQLKIKSAAAGRVQSTALKLICDLEKEITSFIPDPYFEMEALFDNYKLGLDLAYGKGKVFKDRSVLESLQKELSKDFIVNDIINKDTFKESKPCYTTSTLQQDASNKLSFTSSKTMRIAQELYEGKALGNVNVGLITYMRTDSTHLSYVFVSKAKEYIKTKYGDKYLGKVKEHEQNFAQNAHEGIRPTSIERTPEEVKAYLSPDEYKLYKLIYNRTIASLMAAAKLINTKIIFGNTNSLWSTTGQKVVFDGFLKVYGKNEDENKNQEIPNFIIGNSYTSNEINIKDLETKPKSRYTEATLIKDMEEKGIGRPSTYAQTIYNLTFRKYVTIKEKKIIPTEQGILTSSKLDEFFSPIINVEYTASMEEILDKISKGEAVEEVEMSKFYNEFIPLFNNAKQMMQAVGPKKTGETCPLCGGDLVYRDGKYGEFIACSNFPKCKYIKTENDETKEKPLDTGIICPNCGKGHIIRHLAKKGKNAGNYFYSCDNYFKCKTVYNDEPVNKVCPTCGSLMVIHEGKEVCSNPNCGVENTDSTGIKCPKCGKGELVKRIAKKGKNAGNVFYACSNYPRCKNTYSLTPTDKVCEKCGSMMLMDSDSKLVCSNKDCK